MSPCERPHDNKDPAAPQLSQYHCHPVFLMGEFSPGWIDIHCIDPLPLFSLFLA